MPPTFFDGKQYQCIHRGHTDVSSYLVNNLEATGMNFKKLSLYNFYISCVLLLEVTNQTDWIKKASFMNETATFSEGTCDLYFISPALCPCAFFKDIFWAVLCL